MLSLLITTVKPVNPLLKLAFTFVLSVFVIGCCTNHQIHHYTMISKCFVPRTEGSHGSSEQLASIYAWNRLFSLIILWGLKKTIWTALIHWGNSQQTYCCHLCIGPAKLIESVKNWLRHWRKQNGFRRTDQHSCARLKILLPKEDVANF